MGTAYTGMHGSEGSSAPFSRGRQFRVAVISLLSRELYINQRGRSFLQDGYREGGFTAAIPNRIVVNERKIANELIQPRIISGEQPGGFFGEVGYGEGGGGWADAGGVVEDAAVAGVNLHGACVF